MSHSLFPRLLLLLLVSLGVAAAPFGLPDGKTNPFNDTLIDAILPSSPLVSLPSPTPTGPESLFYPPTSTRPAAANAPVKTTTTTIFVMVVQQPPPTLLPPIDQRQRQGRVDPTAVIATRTLSIEEDNNDDDDEGDDEGDGGEGDEHDDNHNNKDKDDPAIPTAGPAVRTRLNTDNKNIAFPLPTTTTLTSAQYALAWLATALLAFLAATQAALAHRFFPSPCAHKPPPPPPAKVHLGSTTTLPLSNKFKSFISESSTTSASQLTPNPTLSRKKILRVVLYMLFKGFATAVFYALVVVAATLNVGLLCAIVVGAMLGAGLTDWMCQSRAERTRKEREERNQREEEYTPYLIGG
ncbi:hypothetical protein DFJ77DRAFT_452391 [Powellomyces hirtus]|nr:hypothetical protein DFJ77DRAFT_452391 [Powellomyces hirtus]